MMGNLVQRSPNHCIATTFSAWWHMPLKETLANDSWKISLMGKISYYYPCIAGLEPRFQVRGDEGRLTLFKQARDFIWDMLGCVYIYILYIYISPIRQIFNIYQYMKSMIFSPYIRFTLCRMFSSTDLPWLPGSQLGLEDGRLSLVG